jgi:hypothetical protein
MLSKKKMNQARESKDKDYGFKAEIASLQSVRHKNFEIFRESVQTECRRQCFAVKVSG